MNVLPGRSLSGKHLLFISICFIAVFLFPFAVKAQNYVVTSNGDTHAVSPTTSANDATNAITLRSAMEAATQIAGTHTITIPSGITVINLTLGQITVGSPTVGNNITVNGPGKAVLTINQTTVNRIFSTGTGAITFSLNDLTLNYTGPTGTISGGGGAIVAGGINAVTSMNNVAINNFNIQIGNGGALSCSTSNTNALTLTNCDFNNNYAGGAAGAVSYNGNSTCTITNCNFNNNQTGPLGANTGGSGGALSTTGSGNGGTYTVTNCNFTNNKVLATGAQGGAIINNNGALTVNFCRFVNNTAATPANGNTIAQIGGASVQTTNANNNWWGDNAPDATDNVVLAAGGSITVTKWLQQKTTVANNPLCAPATTTITTSFLSNSANEALTTGNISKLVGVPVTFANPALGTLSAAQATIQANGTATATFTPGSTGGTAGVDAKVDNIPNGDANARVTFTVNIGSSITGQPAAATACTGGNASFTVGISGGAPAYQWRKGTTNISNGNTGSGSVISGATSATLTITGVTASDAAANYNVVVTPTCGAAATSNSVSLTVNAPATIGTPPASTSICTGQTATFTISASADPSVPITGYQWQKGSTNISNGATGNGGTYSGTTTTTLTISNVSAADAGNYRAVVTNSCGNAFSTAATLTIPAPSAPATTATGSGNISSTVNTIFNGSCAILGTLVPTGTGTALSGNVTSMVTVNANVSTLPSGTVLLARHYDIVPAANAATATANVTLYFLQSEFTQFNSTPGITQLLPASAADPQNYKANIRLIQYHGTGTAPGNYTGSQVTITPTAVAYNNTYACWEVTFPVTGFSGFYLTNTSGIALPLRLVSFTGTPHNGYNDLEWKTVNETHAASFLIERSADATDYRVIGTVKAEQLYEEQRYHYQDATISGTRQYYRLRMTDEDGSSRYSNVVAINNGNNAAAITVSPVPFNTYLDVNINAAEADEVWLSLVDARGRIVLRQKTSLNKGNNAIVLYDLKTLAQGTYFLKISGAAVNKTISIMKVQ